jgi:hypothetical protein
MSLEEELRGETLKWLERAESLYREISGDRHLCGNISAYLQDSKYFLDKKDLVRAFEAVIWAWAWMEIGLELGHLHKGAEDQRAENQPPPKLERGILSPQGKSNRPIR